MRIIAMFVNTLWYWGTVLVSSFFSWQTFFLRCFLDAGCGLRQTDLTRKYDFYDLSMKSDSAAGMQTREFECNGLHIKFVHENNDNVKLINHKKSTTRHLRLPEAIAPLPETPLKKMKTEEPSPSTTFW